MNFLSILFIGVIERHGENSKDDNKLRPIVCLIEGAIHNILLHSDDAQAVRIDFNFFDHIGVFLLSS